MNTLIYSSNVSDMSWIKLGLCIRIGSINVCISGLWNLVLY